MSADEKSSHGDSAPVAKFEPGFGAEAVALEAARAMAAGPHGESPQKSIEELRADAAIASGRLPERLRRIEELLERALGKTALDLRGRLVLNRIAPEQRDCELLLIETLTVLFEEYRFLSGQMRDLSRDYVESRETIAELKEALLAWMKQADSPPDPAK